MGWLARLLRPKRFRRVHSLRELVEGDVEVSGTAEAVESMLDPIHGASVIAVDYRAWPPSTTVGMDGATAHNSRAFQVVARQAVDFVLRDGREQVLVRVRRGDDVTTVHQELLTKYGVGLRTEMSTIPDGARVVVEGRARVRPSGRSPHRHEPHAAEIHAQRVWLADEG